MAPEVISLVSTNTLSHLVLKIISDKIHNMAKVQIYKLKNFRCENNLDSMLCYTKLCFLLGIDYIQIFSPARDATSHLLFYYIRL